MNQTFRANPWRRLDEIGLSLLFTALLGVSVFYDITDPKFQIVMFTLLWVAMASLGWMIFLLGGVELQLGANEITVRSIARTQRWTMADLSSVSTSKSGKSGSIDIRGRKGGSATILLKNFADREAIRTAVEAWWNDHQHAVVKPTEFRKKNLSWMCIVVAIFLVIFGFVGLKYQPSTAAPAIGLSVMGALMGVLGGLSFGDYVRVHDDGIEVRRFGKLDRVLWSDITKVTLTTRASQSSSNELVVVETSAKKFWFGMAFDDLGSLRDAIISHVPPSNICDSRIA